VRLRIVAGGQTGVDRAALDVALARGLECGGWCPAGRRAEDGPVPAHYPLTETPEADYRFRTARNVADSDATLILTAARLAGGTLYTVEEALRAGRPCRVVDLREAPDAQDVRDWLALNAVHTLNVAGPRESSQPGVYARARAWLEALLREPL
jgi:hypothetical protein